MGHAAHLGHAHLLELLLRSCSNSNELPKNGLPVEDEEEADAVDGDGQSEPKKKRSPDDTEGLLWDEEIPADVAVHDDEGSKLYVYVLNN